ncbi:glycosyltransferase family protein [Occultella aeris]|uniref:YfhO family protein n=1 Tax=Occultella aeris TaxID=2761496 RepID=UPI0018D3D672|nr:YfhO family protein [Occultella aeris]
MTADVDERVERPKDHSAPLFDHGGRNRLAAWLLAAAAFAVIGIRLGPSLLGLEVFVGLDLFEFFRPWSELPGAGGYPTSSIYVSDQLDSTLPGMYEIRERFLNGDLALWSSSAVGGFPLFATMHYGMLTPGRWLFFILPTWLAPAWAKLAELAFAAAFTALLARRLKFSRLAAAVAAFIYPMTGFMIGWTNWPQAAVAATIPMVFWSVERFVQLRRVRDILPVALATAILLFGGFPAVAGQTLYLAGAYALVRTIATQRRAIGAIVRDLALLAGGVLIGVALTGFQLVPFASQLLGETDLTYRASEFFSVSQPVFLLTTMFPESFAGNQLWAGASPMDVNAYLGGVTIALATLGVVSVLRGRVPRHVGLFFVGVVLLAVTLIWFQGPWTDWMNNLPIFNGNPIGRFRSQLALPAAILAAAGVDLLRTDSDGESRAFTWPTALAVGAVTALAAAAADLLNSGRILILSEQVLRDTLIAVVPLVLLFGLVLWGLRSRRPRTLVLCLVVLAVPLQALSATAFYWPTGDREDFYRTTSGIEYLQENQGHDRIATLGLPLRPNITQYYGLRTLNGHSFVTEQMSEVFLAINPSMFIGPTYTALSNDIASYGDRAPGLDRFGVRYLVADAEAILPGNVPVTLPGIGDPLAERAGDLALEPGREYTSTIAAGDLRGVHIPVILNAPGSVTVEIHDADGVLLASNELDVRNTGEEVTVPIALSPIDGVAFPDSGDPFTVTVTFTGDGLIGSADGVGNLRVQAVRAPAEGDGLDLAYAGEGLIIWERTTSLSRIRWASEAVVINDDEDRVAAVANDAVDPEAAILAEELPEELAGGTAELTITEDSGDVIRVDVEAETAGLVVVTDTMDDFVATVDGQPADIVTAEHAGGAVLVPAGSHTVELTYAPQSGKLGIGLTIGAAAILLAIGVGSLLLQRRSRRQASDAESDVRADVEVEPDSIR